MAKLYARVSSSSRDSRPLWAKYWHQFNTITVPLLDEDAFFTDALSAAKQAQNRGHLEELLDEISRERRRELEDVISSTGLASFSLHTPFPSEAARLAAGKIGSTGSLDSLLQFVGYAVWGWGNNDKKNSRDGKDGERNAGGSPEEQLEKHSPPEEDSSFDFAGTQELPHMYSPHPVVSDDWDLLDQDRGHWVTELPTSPRKQQLPPPTQAQTSDAAIDAEGYTITDAADLVVPLQYSATSQSTKGSTTQLTPPLGPLSGEGGDTAKQPFKQTSAAVRKESEGDTIYSSRSRLEGSSKAGRKSPFHEHEGSDVEDERCQRRRKAERS